MALRLVSPSIQSLELLLIGSCAQGSCRPLFSVYCPSPAKEIQDELRVGHGRTFVWMRTTFNRAKSSDSHPPPAHTQHDSPLLIVVLMHTRYTFRGFIWDQCRVLPWKRLLLSNWNHLQNLASRRHFSVVVVVVVVVIILPFSFCNNATTRSLWSKRISLLRQTYGLLLSLESLILFVLLASGNLVCFLFALVFQRRKSSSPLCTKLCLCSGCALYRKPRTSTWLYYECKHDPLVVVAPGGMPKTLEPEHGTHSKRGHMMWTP